ncbi:hypothetical protein MRB53_022784 [Persea americana]|uniref:Uncharacterized protein n=1 Tax=Persea americana TaxID=3435 RepID=A0ACC2L7R4_PERAE|nr:hypothetical protein MRB53_022784 [Persea americana]
MIPSFRRVVIIWLEDVAGVLVVEDVGWLVVGLTMDKSGELGGGDPMGIMGRHGWSEVVDDEDVSVNVLGEAFGVIMVVMGVSSP